MTIVGTHLVVNMAHVSTGVTASYVAVILVGPGYCVQVRGDSFSSLDRATVLR